MAMTGGTAKLVSQGTPPRWSGPVSLYVYYKEISQDLINNTTTLSLGMYVTTPSGWDIGSWTDFNGSYIGTATSGTNCKTFNGGIPNFSGTRWLVENQNVTVTHDADGTKKATIYWHWGVNSGWSGVMNNPSGSFTITLATISRTSGVTATDANIESATTITINRAASSFTHRLTYEFGSLKGIIVTNTSDTSVGWTIPASFYAQIPNSPSGECTITCSTYSGSTTIGSTTCKIVVTASKEKCAPSLTLTTADVNSKTLALTGDKKKIVKGVSNLQVAASATARNSATISSVKVYCGGAQQTGTTVTFNGADSVDVYAIATDSRGYETKLTDKTLTLINYVMPTIVPTITRDTPTGDTVTITANGSWFSGSLGTKYNSLWVQVAYKLDGEEKYGTYYTMAMQTSGNTYTATYNLSGLDYTKAYRFQVRLYDEIYTNGEKQASDIYLSKGVPVFDWGENDFKFNVPVEFFDQSLFATQTVHFKGNADDVTYNALLRTDSGATNCPSSNGFLIALAPVPGHVVFQIGCDFKGASLKCRTYWYGTWNDWKTFT